MTITRLKTLREDLRKLPETSRETRNCSGKANSTRPVPRPRRRSTTPQSKFEDAISPKVAGSSPEGI